MIAIVEWKSFCTNRTIAIIHNTHNASRKWMSTIEQCQCKWSWAIESNSNNNNNIEQSFNQIDDNIESSITFDNRPKTKYKTNNNNNNDIDTIRQSTKSIISISIDIWIYIIAMNRSMDNNWWKWIMEWTSIMLYSLYLSAINPLLYYPMKANDWMDEEWIQC